ncbi:Hypothetical protein NGAL_HAMBI490_60860 [Neorhizobium galegae bv. officinalis]|nr:Hypothetical protein NGAL_HAMBI490_60860 [Neorhizobium galegae bv. officinalis]
MSRSRELVVIKKSSHNNNEEMNRLFDLYHGGNYYADRTNRQRFMSTLGLFWTLFMCIGVAFGACIFVQVAAAMFGGVGMLCSLALLIFAYSALANFTK